MRSLLVVVALGACRSTEPATAPSFDLHAIAERAHFAFRADGDRFTGGHTTYTVDAKASGSVAISPARDHTIASPLILDLAPSTIAADGTLVARDGQRLTNTAEGVALAWDVPRAPSGELSLSIPTRGQRYVGVTDGGVHFVDAATGLGMRFGHATWIDATGARTPIPARYDHGAIALVVPHDVIAHSRFPAVLDPIIGPEIAMDSPVVGPAAGIQVSPVIATNQAAGAYMIAFTDLGVAGQQRIIAVRVNGTTVVDPTGILVATTTSVFTQRVAIAFGGGNYFIAWIDDRNSATTGKDIYAARVTAAGAVLDPTGVVVSNAMGDQTAPHVAFNGTNFLVVWSDKRSTTFDIYGERVDINGVASEPTDTNIAIQTAAMDQTNPLVTSDGTNWLVMWTDLGIGIANQSVQGTRVAPAGTTLAPAVSIGNLGSYTGASSITYGGGWYYVTSNVNRDRVYGHRVSTAGVVQTGLLLTPQDGVSHFGGIARFDGTNFVIVYRQGTGLHDLYATRVNTSGAQLPSTQAQGTRLTTSLSADLPDFAFASNNNALLVYEDLRSNTTTKADMYAGRVTTAVTGITSTDPAGFSVFSSDNSEVVPVTAFNGTDYLVAWLDSRGGTSGLYAVRVSALGVVKDANAIQVATNVSDAARPTIASNRTDWMLAWLGASALNARAVTAAGGLGPLRTVVATVRQNASLASDGTGYLVSYTTASAPPFAASAQLLDGTGSNVGAEIALGSTTNNAVTKATFANGNYIVARSAFGTNSVKVARVAPATGMIVDDTTLANTPNITLKGATSVGATVLLAYSEGGPMGILFDTTTQTAGAAFAIHTPAMFHSETSVAVASDGVRFAVAWSDCTNTGTCDLYGTWIRPDGTIDPAAGLVLANQPFDELDPALADGDGKTLLAYDRFVTPGNSPRAVARIVSYQNDGASCAMADECTSGFCANNVCCSVACDGACQQCTLGTGACETVADTGCNDLADAPPLSSDAMSDGPSSGGGCCSTSHGASSLLLSIGVLAALRRRRRTAA